MIPQAQAANVNARRLCQPNQAETLDGHVACLLPSPPQPPASWGCGQLSLAAWGHLPSCCRRCRPTPWVKRGAQRNGENTMPCAESIPGTHEMKERQARLFKRRWRNRNVCKEALKSEVASFFPGLVNLSICIYTNRVFVLLCRPVFNGTCYTLKTNMISTYFSDPTEDRAVPFCDWTWAVVGGDLRSAGRSGWLLTACSSASPDHSALLQSPSRRCPALHCHTLTQAPGAGPTWGRSKGVMESWAQVLSITSHVTLGSCCAGPLMCKQGCK